MAPLVEGGDVVEGAAVSACSVGTLAADVLKPGTENVLIEKNTLLDEKLRCCCIYCVSLLT
ncbi:MAG: hypothetical protein QM736_01660, partial [Vicinamibacterales bacterium]